MNLRKPHGSPWRRALSLFTSRARERRRGKRSRDLERLERRDVLATAVWNNVAWPVDVSGNSPGFVSPIDALLVVNEINSREFSDASGRLPKQVDGATSLPYFDVTCDGFVVPLDALLVINHINSVGSGAGGSPTTLGGVFPSSSCSPQLIEGDDFVSQWSKPLVVPANVSSLEVLIEPPTFDTTSQGTIRDAFEIEVFDQSGFSILPPIQFSHESLLNWTEGFEAKVAPGVRMEPGTTGLMSVIIDVSSVPVGTALTVQTRLVNNDLDDQSSVVVRGVQFTTQQLDPIVSNSAPSPSRSSVVDPVDQSQLIDVTSSLQVSYGQTTLSFDNEKLIANAWVTNKGSIAIRDRLIAVVDQFSSLDADLYQPDGRLADGRAFLDLTPWLPGSRLTTDQSTLPREIQFLHRGQERFLYAVKFYALTNAAPSAFTTSAVTEIGVGSTYRYGAHAIDPEGDELRYSLIVAPSTARIDATTGAIVWSPIESDIGSTRWTLRATDPYGLYTEQTFDVTVLESLQNRPPNFTTTPVLEATASSGFEIATVVVGSQPVAVAVVNGLPGNRIVVGNAGDQRIGVYESTRADEYAEKLSVSTGEPKPNDLVLRSGIEVDVGLPPFLQAADNNAVLGLDQGDFNGDGFIDIAALTYRFETWIEGLPASRHTAEIVVCLGDGSGGFAPAKVVFRSNSQLIAYKYLTAKDVNGDSRLDLVAMEEDSSSLFVVLGDGAGGFQPALTTRSTVALNDFRLVDLDQDGKPDIVGRSWNWSQFGWMKGNGDGTFLPFVDITTGGGVSNQGSELFIRPYQFVDLNKDGSLDIVLSKYGENSTVLLLNDGNQIFSIARTIPGVRAMFLYVADFTGDGNLDILYSRSNEGFPSLLVGDSTGLEYTYKASNTPVSSWPGNRAGDDQPVDIDQDGDLDVVFTSGWNGPIGFDVTQVLKNDGQGNFSLTGYTLQRDDGLYSDLQPMRTGAVGGVILGDYNRDGRVDFATLFNSPNFNGVSVALGTRPGEFMANPTTPMNGNSVFYNYVYAEDFNRDGFQDLLSMPARAVRLGKGDGTFNDPFPATSVGGGDGGVLIEDFNQDGIADLLYSRTYEYVAALGNGDGTFEVTYRGRNDGFYSPSTVQAGDFNNDGYPDFIAKYPVESFLDVMLNDPLNPGVFSRSQQLGMEGIGGLARGYGGAVTVGDFDSDGTLDIVIADARPGEWKRLITYSGRGDGTFVVSHEQADFKDGSFPNWVKSGDLNEDGNLDVLTLTSTGIVVHLGKGDGSFLVPTYLPDNGCFGGVFCHADYDWGHIVDIDSDGHLDLVYTTQATGNLAIRLGHGDGTFAAPTSWQTHLNPVRPDFADLDNDGHLDVVHWTEGGGSVASIYYGARDGLVDMVSADIDHDGNMDVLAVNEANDRLKLFVSSNLGELQRMRDLQTGRAPSAVAVADLDRNQTLEFITANRSGRSISVFTGSLTTQYVPIEYPVGNSPIDVATGDFNRDEYPDVFVLDAENAVWLMAGSAGGLLSTPVAIALGDQPGKFTVQDATGDGFIDLVITLPQSNRLMILPGNGTSFGNPQYLSLSSSPADVAVIDLNGDGRPDLAASLPDRDQVSIFYSRGGGQYANAQLVSVGDQPSSLTVSDVDADGKLDILVTNRGDDTVSILYNRFDPNEVYRYDADAYDPDGDSLTFRVVEGPGGLFIDSQSGQVFWAASPDQIGQHRVVLEANDNRGGFATQTFQIDVQASRENELPLITTTPITKIGAGQTYEYQASAIDGDRETLRYRLLEGPEGATIDAATGLVKWDGTSDRAIRLNPYSSNGYVEVPSSSTLKPTSVTVEGWYKFHSTTLSGGTQILFEIDGIGSPAAYALYTTTSGKLVLDLAQATSGELVRLEGNFVPTLEQWYHFAFSFDDDSGLLNIFVNGELFASRSTDKSILYGPGSFYLGTAGSLMPHVTIDNFRVWNTARTAAQIVEGQGRNYEHNSDLVLDLRFEDQTTISVFDHSPSKNHGFRSGTLPPILVDGLADSGAHTFVVSVEDGRGGFDMQSFDLQIVPELRGSIAGQLFEDTNSDGVKGASESPLPGWLLYLDQNGNSFPDPSEPTASTDATGNYRFGSLLPGSYPVRVASMSGYAPTLTKVAAVSANRETAVDRAIEALALSQIRGTLKTESNQSVAAWKVFADLDLDALWDENEPMALTDSQGHYAIAGLAAGEYSVRADLPSGWSQVGGDARILVSLGANAVSANHDFTLRPNNTSVSGGVHFVTVAGTTVEARQIYRYASLATSLTQTSIVYDLSLAPDGMVVDSTSGMIAWRPTIDQIGVHDVIVRATDGTGSIALHSFRIGVTSPDSSPILVANPSPKAYVGRAYVQDFAAQDAEDGPLTVSIISGPAGSAIDSSSGRLTWTPSIGDVGQVHFTLAVGDSKGNQSTASFSVDVSSDTPNLLPLAIQLPRNSARAGSEYRSQIRATDAIGRPVTWTVAASPNGLVVSPEGSILWTPRSDDIGTKTLHLLATTADGLIQSVDVDLDVIGWLANSAPVITSNPAPTAILGRLYLYQIDVTDADRDQLSFVLLSGPAGMSIHPQLGTVAWTPAGDQLGSSSVIVQVHDAVGAAVTQAFSVRVGRTGGPPIITSIAATEAYVGQGYLHSVRTLPGEGMTLTYRLLAAPEGMDIVSTTGEIVWTPTLQQIGQHSVVLEVSDGIGNATTQSFAIRVRAGSPNQPPRITSDAPRFGSVGSTYSYTMQATDPEGAPLVFSLGRGPGGMTVDPSTGSVQWTPTSTQFGKIVVTLRATDGAGAVAVESFELDVLTQNQIPTVTSIAPLEVPARGELRYDVLARDADLDLLQYRLLLAPAGASIDAFGGIRWRTQADDIGSHDFQVLTSDPRGGEATHSFRLNVIADVVPPKVSLIYGPDSGNVFPWQGPMTLYAKAIDNVEVASLTVTVNGQEIRLDASGQASFSFDQWGFTRLNAVAKAIDTNGNVTEKTVSFGFAFPEGWGGGGVVIPTVAISSPTDAGTVFGMVTITGTASHPDLAGYKLSYRRVDQTEYTQFFESTTPVVNGQLGVWDTSLLMNDEYVIRLEASSRAGVVNVIEHNVGLSGELKLGNFRLSFTDMVIPVAGIPIEITRIYDTLQADRQGDFGYGWRLEYRDTDLRVGVPKSGLEDIGIYSPLRQGVKVYLNVPGVGRQGFTFTPDIRVLPGFGGNNLVLARPRFTPDRGVTSTLSTGTSNYLQVNEYGELFAPGGIPYNPGSPEFGGTYEVTTRDGIKYKINGQGKLVSATDKNDNVLMFSDSGVTGPGGASVAFQRDSQGRITAAVDPLGKAVRYTYSAAGNLVRVTDREGHSTSFDYRNDRKHYLQTVTDPLGRMGVRTDYDANGRLSTIVDANGQRVEISYDPGNQLVTTRDGLNRPTTIEYDDEGNIVSSTDGLGNTSRMTYNDAGDTLSVTDPLGRTVRMTYDASGNVTSVADPTGAVTRTAYDTQGNPLRIVDPLGNVTVMTYDRAGNVTTMVSATGDTTRASYSSNGRLTTLDTASGMSIDVGYGVSGPTNGADWNGLIAGIGYDAAGRPLTRTSTSDGKSTTTSTTYDAEGRVLSTTDETGAVTLFQYDAADQLVSVVSPLGERTEYGYDALGQIVTVVRPDGSTLATTFDAAGQVTSQTDAGGRVTRFEYDNAGRLTVTVFPDGTPLTDGDNPRVRTEYDAAGQIIATIDEIGRRTTFTYDLAGRITSTTDPLGRIIRTQYDAVGRVSSQTDQLGRVTSYTHDAGSSTFVKFADGSSVSTRIGNPKAPAVVTNEIGQVTLLEYNQAGQLKSVVDPLGNRSEYDYDSRSRLVTQTDANGRVTRFEYDDAGRQTARILPGGQQWRTEYNLAGQVTRTIDPDNRVVQYRYDKMGRIIAKSLPSGTVVNYRYTPTGQLASVTDARGVTSYEYDSRDRLTLKSEPDGQTIRYEYDAAGQLVRRTTLAGVVTFAYDAAGQLTSVTDESGGVTSYTFDLAGQLIRTNYPNGIVEQLDYDLRGRLIRKTASGPSGVLTDYRYTLDPAGRIVQATELGRSMVYSYDAANRLIRETTTTTANDTTSVTYEYDSVGNRLSRGEDGRITSYQYDINDRLIRQIDDGLTMDFSYDQSGNQLSSSTALDRTDFTWDDQRRLVSATVTTGGIARTESYRHDDSGVRVAVIAADGTETRFLVDTSGPLSLVFAEYTPTGTLVTSRVGMVEISGGFASVLLSDRLGSVRVVTDASGNSVSHFDYDAYGRLVTSSGTSTPIGGYAGESRDALTGLDYLRARSYDPSTGRFVSADPYVGILANPLSRHRYQYADLNPVSNTDPTGMATLTETLTVENIKSILATSSAVQSVKKVYQGVKDFIGVAETVVIFGAAAAVATSEVVMMAGQSISNASGNPGSSAYSFFDKFKAKGKLGLIDEINIAGAVSGKGSWSFSFSIKPFPGEGKVAPSAGIKYDSNKGWGFVGEAAVNWYAKYYASRGVVTGVNFRKGPEIQNLELLSFTIVGKASFEKYTNGDTTLLPKIAFELGVLGLFKYSLDIVPGLIGKPPKITGK